jgi:hypothetical protein
VYDRRNIPFDPGVWPSQNPAAPRIDCPVYFGQTVMN